MEYYFDYLDRLDERQLELHNKAQIDIRDWLDNRKEDLENFLFNYIDIKAEGGTYDYNLEMCNRWYAIAHLILKLDWDY